MFSQPEEHDAGKYGDKNLPKNKNEGKFLEAVKDMTKSRKFLQKKQIIDANHRGLKFARDLPNDHIYGRSSLEYKNNDLAGTMKN